MNTLILLLDHYLLRCEQGLCWLDRLSSKPGQRVICGADFMGHRRRLLEAQRAQLYKEMPVVDGWHQANTHGADAGFDMLRQEVRGQTMILAGRLPVSKEHHIELDHRKGGLL